MIILFGGFLRILDLGAESLWLDEVWSVEGSGEDLISVITNSGREHNQPPLYFMLLHFWMLFFGTSEVAVRSLSAVFGIVSVFLFFKVGCQLFNHKVGLIAGLISATSCFYIHYSQETRAYSLLLMLSLLSYYFFIKALRAKRKSDFAGLFLANVCLAYTHVYGLLVIASQVFYLALFFKKHKDLLIRFLCVQIATVVVFAPWIPTLLQRISGLSHGFWISEPSLSTVLDTFGTYSGYRWGKEYLIWGFLFLCFIGLLTAARRSNRWIWQKVSSVSQPSNVEAVSGSVEGIPLLLIWLIFPLLIPFVVSQFSTPIYLTKYTIVASPAFYLLVARGVSVFPKQVLLFGVLLGIILLSMPGLNMYYSKSTKPEWREAVNLIESGSQDSDFILIWNESSRRPFGYYYDGNVEKRLLYWRIKLDDTLMLDTFLDGATNGKKRLWVLLEGRGNVNLVRRYFIQRYGKDTTIVEKDFERAGVLLFELPCPQIPKDTFTHGLVGYWAMDEGDGQHVKDGSGNNMDGHLGNNRAVAGDTSDPIWTNGKTGYGLLFDGIDDYVNCGYPIRQSITDSITCEAWVYLSELPTNTGHSFSIVNRLDGDTGYTMYIRGSDNTLKSELNGLDDKWIYGRGTLLESGGWYHVAIVWDGSVVSSYVNGVIDLVDEDTGVISARSGTVLNLSHREMSFNGIIDEIRLYNRALSPDEIYYHFTNSGNLMLDNGIHDAKDNQNH